MHAMENKREVGCMCVDVRHVSGRCTLAFMDTRGRGRDPSMVALGNYDGQNVSG